MSPEGVLIMNFTFDVTELTEAIQRVFPSPTGVNHYECCIFTTEELGIAYSFPSPTGVSYYE